MPRHGVLVASNYPDTGTMVQIDGRKKLTTQTSLHGAEVKATEDAVTRASVCERAVDTKRPCCSQGRRNTLIAFGKVGHGM